LSNARKIAVVGVLLYEKAAKRNFSRSANQRNAKFSCELVEYGYCVESRLGIHKWLIARETAAPLVQLMEAG
jgi:hypothetical protein